MRKKKYIYGDIEKSEISGVLGKYKGAPVSDKKIALEGLADKYSLQYRQLDSEGKTIHSYNSSRVPAFRTVALMVTILAGVFFLSPALTGNTIANLAVKTSNLIGAGLFIAGVAGTYSYFRKR